MFAFVGAPPVIPQHSDNATSHTPSVAGCDRVAQQQAMVLAFMCENNMSFSSIPNLIELVKELARDRTALSKLKMDRTSASIKLKHGLAKTMTEDLVSELKSSFFSLNIDEATSNNNKKVETKLSNHIVNLCLI